MAYKGRRAAKGMVVAVVVLVAVMVQIETCDAAIGGRGRWTFMMARWPRSKHFRAGNVIAFNYDSEFHNVVSENKAGYIRCIIPRGSRLFQSSKDRNGLRRAANYFICSIPGHAILPSFSCFPSLLQHIRLSLLGCSFMIFLELPVPKVQQI